MPLNPYRVLYNNDRFLLTPYNMLRVVTFVKDENYELATKYLQEYIGIYRTLVFPPFIDYPLKESAPIWDERVLEFVIDETLITAVCYALSGVGSSIEYSETVE